MDTRNTTGRNVAQVSCGRQAPLTFRGYLSVYLDRVEAGDARPVRVQVRKRGAVLCGRVLEGYPGETGDWFHVASPIGHLWVAANNVRHCDFDGRCVCALDAQAAKDGALARRRAACAVPLGNTGTTTVKVA